MYREKTLKVNCCLCQAELGFAQFCYESGGDGYGLDLFGVQVICPHCWGRIVVWGGAGWGSFVKTEPAPKELERG